MKETIQAQPDPPPLSDHQIPESDNESNSSGLDLVKLAQPPTRQPSPGQSALRQSVIPPQPPIVPLPVPWQTTPLPDMETAPLLLPTPQYLLHPTKDRLGRGSQVGLFMESINQAMIHMFQEVPDSYQEAMNLPDKNKWLKASEE